MTKNNVARLAATVSAIASLDAYNPAQQAAAVPAGIDFHAFKSGIGASAVMSLLKLDISDCATWEDFQRAALGHRASFGGEFHDGFLNRVVNRFGPASTGEQALILAILYSMDYRALADRLATEAGTTFLTRMEYADKAHRHAAACCLARID